MFVWVVFKILQECKETKVADFFNIYLKQINKQRQQQRLTFQVVRGD